MKAPIILPRGMDEPLQERRQAIKLLRHACESDKTPNQIFQTQWDWLDRLNALIDGRAAA